MILSIFKNMVSGAYKQDDIGESEALDKLITIQKYKEKQLNLVSSQMANFGLGVPKDKNEDNLLESYNEVNWVHNAVELIADASTLVPIKIYEKDDSLEDREEVKTGLAYDLFQEPNKFNSFPEFQANAISFLCLTGNSYSWLSDDKRQIYNLRPANVIIKASAIDIIKYYCFINDTYSVSQKMDPEQVVHAKLFNPSSKGIFYGASPLESAWDAVNYNQKESEFQNLFWKEGGRLQGAFVSQDVMDADQIKAFRAQIKKQYRGSANMFKDLILMGGVDYKQMGVSASDQKIIERRRMSTEDILAAYRVPPAMVGLLEFSNFSNVEVQERLFWVNAVMPKLRRFLYALNRNEILSENGRYVFEHDYSNIPALKEGAKQKAEVGEIMIRSGQFTQNEVRGRLWGAEPIEGGDELKEINPANSNPLLTLAAKPDQTKSLELPSPVKVYGPSTYSVEQKDSIYKEFDSDLQENDNELKNVTVSHFRYQREQILKNIRLLNRQNEAPKQDDFRQLFSGLEDEAQKYKEDLAEPMRKVIDKFGNRELRRMRSRLSKYITSLQTKASDDDIIRNESLLQPEFDFRDPRVHKYLVERPIGVAGIVDQNTLRDLRAAISDDIKNGASYVQIADTVESYFDSIEKFRALRIARTETASAANMAIDRTYAQNSDALWGKQWIDSQDDLVRDSHVASSFQTQLGGEAIVKIDEDFINSIGNAAPRPTAFGLPEEDINCRCTMAPITLVDALDRGIISQSEFDEAIG